MWLWLLVLKGKEALCMQKIIPLESIFLAYVNDVLDTTSCLLMTKNV